MHKYLHIKNIRDSKKNKVYKADKVLLHCNQMMKPNRDVIRVFNLENDKVLFELKDVILDSVVFSKFIGGFRVTVFTPKKLKGGIIQRIFTHYIYSNNIKNQ